MTVETWQCERCMKLNIQLRDGTRGRAGHLPGVCFDCSCKQAIYELADTPPSVRWLIERLNADLDRERKDRAEDIRDMQREARAEWT